MYDNKYDNEIIKKHRDQIRKSILNQFGVTESEIDDLEKGSHYDGEVHPNGKWVWVASAANGKGDWRVKKQSVPTTAPASTETASTQSHDIKSSKNENILGDLSNETITELKFSEKLIISNIQDLKLLLSKTPNSNGAKVQIKRNDLLSKIENSKKQLSEIRAEIKKRDDAFVPSYSVDTLKKILKEISKLPNSWSYYLEDSHSRYSFSVSQNEITKYSTSYTGVVYTRTSKVDITDSKVIEFIDKYKNLINV